MGQREHKSHRVNVTPYRQLQLIRHRGHSGLDRVGPKALLRSLLLRQSALMPTGGTKPDLLAHIQLSPLLIDASALLSDAQVGHGLRQGCRDDADEVVCGRNLAPLAGKCACQWVGWVAAVV